MTQPRPRSLSQGSGGCSRNLQDDLSPDIMSCNSTPFPQNSFTRHSSSKSPSYFYFVSVIVLFFASFIAPTLALVDTMKFRDSSARAMHLRSFGFAQGGQLTLNMTGFLIKTPVKVPMKAAQILDNDLAFVIDRADLALPVDSATHTPLRKDKACLHRDILPPTNLDFSPAEDNEDGKKDGKSDDENPAPFVTPSTKVFPIGNPDLWESYSMVLPITKEGNYHVYFSNCVPDSTVSYRLKIEEYNIDPISGDKNYLPIGEQRLPTMLGFFSLLFFTALAVWVRAVFSQWSFAKSIHILMMAVITAKAITTALEGLKYATLASKGSHNAWAILYYVANTIRGIGMFLVLALIGLGWSHLKPFLTERDRTLLLAVFITQVFVNIAWIVADSSARGSNKSETWIYLFYLADLLCCVLVVLPIVLSMNKLRSEMSRSEKAAQALDRLKRFRSFYVAVVVYVYVTRLLGVMLDSTAPYRLAWLPTFVRETLSLVLFVATGYLFAPRPSGSLYLPLDNYDPDDEEGNVAFNGDSNARRHVIGRGKKTRGTKTRKGVVSQNRSVLDDYDNDLSDGDDIVVGNYRGNGDPQKHDVEMIETGMNVGNNAHNMSVLQLQSLQGSPSIRNVDIGEERNGGSQNVMHFMAGLDGSQNTTQLQEGLDVLEDDDINLNLQ